MRYGFTTGSCAAAAAKAAAYMLFTGKIKNEIEIETPKGIRYHAAITDIRRGETEVSCAVIKDGGDDPDITTGAHIVATVSRIDSDMQQKGKSAHSQKIVIDGGYGVGRVTKPGLDQPVGNAAINHVPREMIEKEVREVCALTDEWADILVEISVPEGEELASQTFNPRLGITGGISILGTSGIVEPMSSRALLETIRVELKQKRALGNSIVAVSPGNYGLDYMKRTYGYDLDKSVKCSNFIGDTIDMAVENGFKAMLLTGHIGKLVKVAGGIMNTHSREGDCRMELIASSALLAGADADTACQILSCVTTEEAVNVLKKAGLCEQTMKLIMQKIMFYLNKRAAGKIVVECILYSNEHGGLGESDGAAELIGRLKEEKQ
ncbi:cobalamin biosynthesis protein CbiD [Roseburia sp. AM23-20]|uniref:cobalt-precorrin-5B (C(1))-methyltransferase CbiD n=1 Tax=Roseburia sp. AM23-20 TaxID=2292066 RepID=UPI000E47016E|nr:cobalt-precorrin-5B (C(1))-methyltransferase CbiD [Roseburia sp. AM23-20]RHF91661.1 cobalamin biosynthesis protein CbiD [Roseburia sp. AM23-20]